MKKLSILLLGLVAGSGIAALGGLLLSLAPEAWREMNDVWTEAPGEITGVRVSVRQVRTGSQPRHYRVVDSHAVLLDCRYAVAGGLTKEGKDLVAPRQPRHAAVAEEALVVAAAYRVGEPIPVYHHPAEPDRARLEPNAPNGLFILSAVFGPVIILAGLGLAWWTWSDWRTKRL